MAVAEFNETRATDLGDPEVDAVERGRAADRALFDPSHEAVLARRYEAASERGFFRALRELKQLAEAEAEAEPAPVAVPVVAGPIEPEALGSFGAEPFVEPSPLSGWPIPLAAEALGSFGPASGLVGWPTPLPGGSIDLIVGRRNPVEPIRASA